MDVWVLVSEAALNMDLAYLSAKWRMTALQVSKRVCTSVLPTPNTSLFFTMVTAGQVVF